MRIWSERYNDQRAKCSVGLLRMEKYRRNIRAWEPVNEIIVKLIISLLLIVLLLQNNKTTNNKTII